MFPLLINRGLQLAFKIHLPILWSSIICSLGVHRSIIISRCTNWDYIWTIDALDASRNTYPRRFPLERLASLSFALQTTSASCGSTRLRIKLIELGTSKTYFQLCFKCTLSNDDGADFHRSLSSKFHYKNKNLQYEWSELFFLSNSFLPLHNIIV